MGISYHIIGVNKMVACKVAPIANLIAIIAILIAIVAIVLLMSAKRSNVK